jgi:hypothetical protein
VSVASLSKRIDTCFSNWPADPQSKLPKRVVFISHSFVWRRKHRYLRKLCVSTKHWLRLFRAFSSVVRQMPGYTSQRWGMVHTLPNQWIMLFYVLFVCKCVLYYCHRVSTQLQLNILYHTISYIISYHILYQNETSLKWNICVYLRIGCVSVLSALFNNVFNWWDNMASVVDEWDWSVGGMTLTFKSLVVSLRTIRFNIQIFYMVLALRWVFFTDLSTNSDLCFVHH